MKDDLTIRYEEILRLREELERLLARSKRSRSRKNHVPAKRQTARAIKIAAPSK
jgi:hypothetical protein